MAYSQQTWVDGSAGGTPVNAARLNHMEAGIAAATGAGGATISDGGTWTTGTAYTPGQTVTKSGVRYECAVAHTAGTFATDLSAGKWVTLGVDPSSATTLPTDAAGWLHDDGSGVLVWTTPTATQVGADASGAASTAQAFAIQRANHTGTQAATTITGLATVATSGAYTDLSAKPTIPTVGAAGAGAAIALSSTDASVTNARTPTAHASTHASGGSDPVTPAAIGAAPLVESVNTVASSGTAQTLPDVTTATIHDITLTGNCTLTFPTLAAGKSLTIRFTQDATGSRTVTWPGTVKWPGGTAPTLSTAAGKLDVLSFVSIGGTSWSGFVAGLDMR